MKKELCRDLIGAMVVLRRVVRTKGGEIFWRGEIMRVESTWRGRFELAPVLSARRGCYFLSRRVRGVRRHAFGVVLPVKRRQVSRENLTHKDCGGAIVNDDEPPAYPDPEGGEPHPVQRCEACWVEIIGDAQVELPESWGYRVP